MLVRVVLCCILLSWRDALTLLAGLEFAASGRGQLSQAVFVLVGSLTSPSASLAFWGTATSRRGTGTLLLWPRLTADQRGIVRDAAAWYRVRTASDVLGTTSSHLPLHLLLQ